jgi:hypothetical protein
MTFVDHVLCYMRQRENGSAALPIRDSLKVVGITS